MNRRDNGVTIMNTPRRAFGELKNIAYSGTPRSLDNIKARSNIPHKNVDKVFSDDAPTKRVLLSSSIDIPTAPQFHRLKKADSLEELCDIAGAKRSFAVYNDSDLEIETFGEKDNSFQDSCINHEESIVLTEEDTTNGLRNTLSPIEEVSLIDFDAEVVDLKEEKEDFEIEAPFAGGTPGDFDDFAHVPEELELNDDLEPQFYSTSYVASDDDDEEEYDSDSDEELSINDDDLCLKEAALAEMLTHVHFTDFVC